MAKAPPLGAAPRQLSGTAGEADTIHFAPAPNQYSDAFWSLDTTPHAADNPFSSGAAAPARAAQSARPAPVDAAETQRRIFDENERRAFTQIANSTEKGAAKAIASGDIQRARYIKNAAAENIDFMNKARPAYAHMADPKLPHHGSYAAFVEKNAERDRTAFLHDNAMQKFKAAASSVSKARANASLSNRIIDALRTGFKTIVKFIKPF